MRIVKSDTIPLEAIKYLQQAIDRTPACAETIESVIQGIEQKADDLYLIEEDGEIYAAMLSCIEDNPKGGQYFNVVLLGGKKMKRWSPFLSEFFLELAKDYTVICVGRKGWYKIFPVKEIGTICVIDRGSL